VVLQVLDNQFQAILTRPATAIIIRDLFQMAEIAGLIIALNANVVGMVRCDRTTTMLATVTAMAGTEDRLATRTNETTPAWSPRLPRSQQRRWHHFCQTRAAAASRRPPEPTRSGKRRRKAATSCATRSRGAIDRRELENEEMPRRAFQTKGRLHTVAVGETAAVQPPAESLVQLEAKQDQDR